MREKKHKLTNSEIYPSKTEKRMQESQNQNTDENKAHIVTPPDPLNLRQTPT